MQPTEDRVQLRYRDPTEFLDIFLADVGIGGFQWVTNARPLDEELHFTFSFIGFQQTFDLSGKVVWSQSPPPMRPHLPTGVGVQFDPACQLAVKELVRFVTKGHKSDALQSRDDRIDNRLKVELECEYLHKKKLCCDPVLNLSSTGLAIETRHVLEEGRQFVFLLHNQIRVQPLVMEGVVVWSKEDDISPGFGVQFIFDSRVQKSIVEKFINSLTEDLDGAEALT